MRATGVAALAKVRPLRARDLKRLRGQLLHGTLARMARARLLPFPAPVVLRPIVASRHLGRTLVLLAGRLPGRRAEMIVSGPGYNVVRPLRVTNRLAGLRVLLPKHLRAGRWFAGIVDYNGLHATHGHLSGRAVLEAGAWQVH